MVGYKQAYPQAVAIIVGVVFLLLLSMAGAAQEMSFVEDEQKKLPLASVTGIVSGNQIEIEMENTSQLVQLHGVASPADVNPLREGIFHQSAVTFLEKFIMAQDVRVAFVGKAEGDAVREGYLYRETDRLFVNYTIIRLGFGHAELSRPYRYQRLFRNGEREARLEGVGLWGMKPPKKRELKGRSGDLQAGLHDDDTVYLTLLDKKYHRDYCTQLRQGRFPVRFYRARQAGYTPCTLCMPESEQSHPETKR
ncbi:hypothetical protein K8S19_01105 [bacterium]|nr:hypothetical protein [bacterium]